MPSVSRGAFRPLLWWFVASSLLFLWQYHQGRARRSAIQFSLSMEGGRDLFLPNVILDGLPYRAGEPCGVGWKMLVVRALNAEPFKTNCFVWYGGKSFGAITLARTRGSIGLEISPPAESIRIVGPDSTKTLTKISHESVVLPTGQYAIEASFAHLSISRTVEVLADQTTPVVISYKPTTLRLSSDPDNAEFELKSKTSPEITVTGHAPTEITDLPVGDYELRMARGDYQKVLPIKLKAEGTNEIKVEFRYAKLSIASEPSEAAISDGTRIFGKTPTTFDLQPGSYNFQINKDGYFGTNVQVVLSETDTNLVSVILINVSFVEAVDRARNQSSGFLADYDHALADVEKALQIRPGDETALQLKQKILFDQRVQKTRQFLRNGDFSKGLSEADAALKLSANNAEVLSLKEELTKGQAAAENEAAKAKLAVAAEREKARRDHPKRELEKQTSSLVYQDLFPSQSSAFAGSLETVHSAILRAFGRNPAWKIESDNKSDPDTVVLRVHRKQFGAKQEATLVLGQTSENEVTVWFKLFSLTLGFDDGLVLKTPPGELYKPVDRRYFADRYAQTMDGIRTSNLQEFNKRIEEELH